MTWLERRMREHGMTVRQLALRARISMRLIHILMRGDKTSVTHPRIAERIAEILGATDAEWDSIVPQQYRGQRKKYAPKRQKEKAMPKCVKVIDRKGRTLHVCESAKVAADMYGVSDETVRNRCNGTARRANFDEFDMIGVSFRWVEGGERDD